MKNVRLFALLIVLLAMPFSVRADHSYYAPGWWAGRDSYVGCRHFQFSGAPEAGKIHISVVDHDNGVLLYSYDYYQVGVEWPYQDWYLPVCAIAIDLYIYEWATDYTVPTGWLIYAPDVQVAAIPLVPTVDPRVIPPPPAQTG